MSLELLFPDKRYILSSNVNNLYDDGRSYSIVWQRSMIPVLFFLFILLSILWDANRLLIGWFAASNEREKLRYAWKNQSYNKYHASQAQWRWKVLLLWKPKKVSIYRHVSCGRAPPPQIFRPWYMPDLPCPNLEPGLGDFKATIKQCKPAPY